MTIRPTTKSAKRAPAPKLKTSGAKPQKPIRGNGLATATQIVDVSRKYCVYAPRLRTLSDWHLLLGKVTRAMLKGLMPPEIGTRFAYVCRTGADMAKALQELKELEALRVQLEALRSSPLLTQGLIQADSLDGSEAQSGDLVVSESQEPGRGECT